jgi:hypothetical protein
VVEEKKKEVNYKKKRKERGMMKVKIKEIKEC